MLYSAGYEYGYVSVDLGGAYPHLPGPGRRLRRVGLQHRHRGDPGRQLPRRDRSRPAAPRPVSTTNGTLTIAPYVVPTPIDHLSASRTPTSRRTGPSSSAATTTSATSARQRAASSPSRSTAPTSTAQPCVLRVATPPRRRPGAARSSAELGMNSVTAVVTEGDPGRSGLARERHLRGRPSAPRTRRLSTRPADGAGRRAGIRRRLQRHRSGDQPAGRRVARLSDRLRLLPLVLRPRSSGRPVRGPARRHALNAGEYEVRVSTEDVNGVTGPRRRSGSAPSRPETSDEPAVNCTFTPGRRLTRRRAGSLGRALRPGDRRRRGALRARGTGSLQRQRRNSGGAAHQLRSSASVRVPMQPDGARPRDLRRLLRLDRRRGRGRRRRLEPQIRLLLHRARRAEHRRSEPLRRDDHGDRFEPAGPPHPRGGRDDQPVPDDGRRAAPTGTAPSPPPRRRPRSVPFNSIRHPAASRPSARRPPFRRLRAPSRPWPSRPGPGASASTETDPTTPVTGSRSVEAECRPAATILAELHSTVRLWARRPPPRMARSRSPRRSRPTSSPVRTTSC